MKTVNVSAAIIIDNDKIFAAQRNYGEFKGGWEFPGGKIESDETKEQAIVREIKEELATTVEVEKYFDTVEYDYSNFHLTMDCFICKVKNGKLDLSVHDDSKWLNKDNLDTVNWLPADRSIVDKLKSYLENL